MHKESRAFGGQISQFRIDLETNDDAVDKVRNTLQKARGERASLEALQRASTGRDRENVNAWLNQKGLGQASRTVESLKIEAGWEYAVEVVLGKSLQAVVVDNLDEFFALIGDFPKGAAEFVQGKNQRKSVSTRVDNRKTMASVVDGDFANWESLSNIYLAETLEEASALRSTLGNIESWFFIVILFNMLLISLYFISMPSFLSNFVALNGVCEAHCPLLSYFRLLLCL